MKKGNRLTGLLAVALMAGTLMAPVAVSANTVDTSNDTGEATGTVQGEIKSTAIAQLKVTLPLRMDFVIAPTAGGAAADNKAFFGTYELSNEGVDLKITNVKVTANGSWELNDGSALNTAQTIKMDVLGKTLTAGDNALSPAIDVASGTTVLPTKMDMRFTVVPTITQTISSAVAAGKAFDVVYTVERKDKNTPQP